MRSFRAAVAQDADFADGIPEAAAWLGFRTRRNPLFLPPRSNNDEGHSCAVKNVLGTDGCVGNITGDQLARLWDAQEYALGDVEMRSGTRNEDQKLIGNRAAADIVGGEGGEMRPHGAGGGGTESPSGVSRSLRRERTRALNAQLAAAQKAITEHDEALHSLEAERDQAKKRAAAAREAAVQAGRQRLSRKMYHLRGIAACLEDGVEDLEREINAVRVRLFAEKLVRASAFSLGVLAQERVKAA